MGGVNHQPLEVRIVDDLVQQVSPDAPVPPATEAAMGVLPIPVVGRRSRQGAPVRKFQNTASRNRRLSRAGLPLLPGPPGKWGCKRSQTWSVMSCRRCAAVIFPTPHPFFTTAMYHHRLNLTTLPSGQADSPGMRTCVRMCLSECTRRCMKRSRPKASGAAEHTQNHTNWGGLNSE